MDMELVRLNKFLSEAGVCSRREADRWTQEGLIIVNGEIATIGMKVSPDAKIEINGEPIRVEKEKVLLVFHKPAGVVCTAEKREKNNVIDYLKYPKRIFPIGRLDKDSTGLLLMTNDGDLVNKIMRAGNYHEKEYIVTVNRPITYSFIKKMASGVEILDTITRKCKVEKTGEKQFRIVLTQGLNRQIRRMCEALGYRVTALKRVRIMNIQLGDLKEGAYRYLTIEEEKELMGQLEASSSLSVKEQQEGNYRERSQKEKKSQITKELHINQTVYNKHKFQKSGKENHDQRSTKKEQVKGNQKQFSKIKTVRGNHNYGKKPEGNR